MYAYDMKQMNLVLEKFNFTGDSCVKAAITLLSEEMDELEVGEPLIIEYVSSLVSQILLLSHRN